MRIAYIYKHLYTCYQYKLDNDKPLPSVTNYVYVNIYRELRIHLYYQPILGVRFTNLFQIYDLHQFFKLYNPVILSCQ